MTDIAKIAAGLNDDQRWLIEQLPATGKPRTWEAGLPNARFPGLRGFGRSDLIHTVHDHAGAHISLTPLGLALRAHLKEPTE